MRLHSAGGERAEVELVAAEVLELLRDGHRRRATWRSSSASPARTPRWSSRSSTPTGSRSRSTARCRSRHTALGRGLLALLRCAAELDGSADDLLAYLRTPGLLEQPELADRLEADVRGRGARTADEARAIWEADAGRWELDEIDRLRAAPAGPRRCLRGARRGARAAVRAPYRRRRTRPRRAPSSTTRAPSRPPARRSRELRALRRRRLPSTRAASTTRSPSCRCARASAPQPDRVQVAAPGEHPRAPLRGGLRLRPPGGRVPAPRRARAVPARRRPPRDRDARSGPAAAAARGPARPRALPLLRLRLARRAAAGAVELALLRRGGRPASARRSSSTTWPTCSTASPDRSGAAALGRHLGARRGAHAAEWERAVGRWRAAPEPPRRRPADATRACWRSSASGDSFSAGALEAFADCPVKWLVETLLRPDALEPDPEYDGARRLRARRARADLPRLREQTGARRVTRGRTCAEAERLLLEALRENQGEFRLSPEQTRVRAAVRRLEFDLLRYLRHEAAQRQPLRAGRTSSCEFDEVPLELGREACAAGSTASTPGTATRSCATTRAGEGGPLQGRELARGAALQVALYMLVLERCSTLSWSRPAASTRPLGGSDRARAGWWPAELRDELGSGFSRNDWQPHEELRASTAEASAGVFRVVEEISRAGWPPAPTPAPTAAAAPIPASAGSRSDGAHELTAEQRTAVDRRDGSLLVRAGAGTGKTRCWSSASWPRRWRTTWRWTGPRDHLHREGGRRAQGARAEAFLERGRRDLARDAEAAWISTIHGFCARLLRTHALAAGLDPEYRVLDEVEAERLAIDAFDRALDDFLGDPPDSERLDLLAAYTPDKLRGWCGPSTPGCAAAAVPPELPEAARRRRRASASRSRPRRAPRCASSAAARASRSSDAMERARGLPRRRSRARPTTRRDFADLRASGSANALKTDAGRRLQRRARALPRLVHGAPRVRRPPPAARAARALRRRATAA